MILFKNIELQLIIVRQWEKYWKANSQILALVKGDLYITQIAP